jgi:hypothetical protein
MTVEMENGEWRVGRVGRSRPFFIASAEKFSSRPISPFSIFHVAFFFFKKSLRCEKTFPIFTRHKRMALLLPV